MNFDKLDDICGDNSIFFNQDDPTDRSMTVWNLVDKTILRTNNRIIKHSMNQMSPSQTQRLETFLKEQQLETPSNISRNRLDTEVLFVILETGIDDCIFFRQKPERVFYLDLNQTCDLISVDWCEELLAVGIDEMVIVWNELSNYSILVNTYDGKMVSAVKWAGTRRCNGNKKVYSLAVATDDGDLDIWELGEMFTTADKNEVGCNTKIIRQIPIKFKDDDKIIKSLSFANNILSVGSASGMVEHHDLRLSRSLVAFNEFHKKV